MSAERGVAPDEGVAQYSRWWRTANRALVWESGIVRFIYGRPHGGFLDAAIETCSFSVALDECGCIHDRYTAQC